MSSTLDVAKLQLPDEKLVYKRAMIVNFISFVLKEQQMQQICRGNDE